MRVYQTPGVYHERLYLVWRKGARLYPELAELLAELEAAPALTP